MPMQINNDLMTDTITRLGLINQALTIYDDLESKCCVMASRNVKAPLTNKTASEYMRETSMADVISDMSKIIAAMAHEDPDCYHLVMESVLNSGQTGYVVMRPIGNVWPDAITAVIPEIKNPEYFIDPMRRVFPVAHLTSLITKGTKANTDPNWYEQNPRFLTVSRMVGEDAMFEGWNKEHGTRVDISALKVDFSNPWRIVQNPDGSDTIVPVEPTKCINKIMNLWDVYDGGFNVEEIL